MNGMIFLVVVMCYILVAYGACNVIVYGEGPFYIFSKFRSLMSNINEHLGKAFNCMMCLPANFGWICSLVNWFFIPISFTPFNIVFGSYENLWWLAALCDGALTSGSVYIIHIIVEYLEKMIDYYEQGMYRDESNTEGFDKANGLLVDDITLKNDDNV
jgi:hypothetical protein